MTIYEKTLATRKPVTEVRCAVLPERMPVIPEEKLTDAQRKVGADIASTPRGSVRGPFVAMMPAPASRATCSSSVHSYASNASSTNA